MNESKVRVGRSVTGSPWRCRGTVSAVRIVVLALVWMAVGCGSGSNEVALTDLGDAAPPAGAVRTSTIEDTDIGTTPGSVEYTGDTWTQCGGCNVATDDSSYYYGYAPGQSYTVRFTGVRLEVYAPDDLHGGTARVTVDDAPAATATVDFLTADTPEDGLRWDSGILPNGDHTVVFTIEPGDRAVALFDRADVYTPGDEPAIGDPAAPSTTESPTTEPPTTAPPTTAPPTTQPPADDAPAAPGPSGLPWASGVHSANDLDENLRFGTWRGRPLDVAHTFTVRDGGWDPIVRPVDFLEGLGWKSFDGLLVISQPMYPQGGGNNAACARGEYDGHWADFGTYLQSIGRADERTIVRIGWEFNGGFMYWHTDGDPTDFKSCWRHVAQAIKTTAPDVLTDWTVNGHGGEFPSSRNMYDAYPGDDVVDIVGMDTYDMYSAPRNASSLTDEEFRTQCEVPNGHGVCDLARFARDHGKKLSVGEWGVLGSCGGATGSGHAEADNAVYIRNMANFFYENRDILAYEAYYDDPAVGNVCSTLYRSNADRSSNPRASAEYLRWFGPDSPYAGENPP
jgi:Glycosyl hydrolase family 26